MLEVFANRKTRFNSPSIMCFTRVQIGGFSGITRSSAERNQDSTVKYLFLCKKDK